MMGNDGKMMGKSMETMEMMGKSKALPSGYVNIAIENGHRNSGFSH